MAAPRACRAVGMPCLGTARVAIAHQSRARAGHGLRMVAMAQLRDQPQGRAAGPKGNRNGKPESKASRRRRQQQQQKTSTQTPDQKAGGDKDGASRTASLSPEALRLCEDTLESGREVTAGDVLSALRATHFPVNTSRKSVMPEGQSSIDAFCIGLVGSRWAQVSEDTRATDALGRLLCRFIRGEHGPPGGSNFPFTSIQLNSRYASKRHVDANNAGHSMIIGLGDYEGGLLDVDGVGQLDVNRAWHRFDGNVPHCTTPVSGGGERYSLIYFTNSSLVHAEPGAVLELQSLGFNLDTLERAGGLEQQEDVLMRIKAADTGEARCLVVENLSIGVFGESTPLPMLEWHRAVRLFVRKHTSSAQVAWLGLCLNEETGAASELGFVVVRHADTVDAVARALRKSSKGRLQVQRYSEWKGSSSAS